MPMPGSDGANLGATCAADAALPGSWSTVQIQRRVTCLQRGDLGSTLQGPLQKLAHVGHVGEPGGVHLCMTIMTTMSIV